MEWELIYLLFFILTGVSSTPYIFRSEDEDLCTGQPDYGSCNFKKFEKWAYDCELETCRKFTYGGCSGNKNRHDSFEQCLQTCTNSSACTKKRKSLPPSNVAERKRKLDRIQRERNFQTGLVSTSTSTASPTTIPTTTDDPLQLPYDTTTTDDPLQLPYDTTTTDDPFPKHRSMIDSTEVEVQATEPQNIEDDEDNRHHDHDEEENYQDQMDYKEKYLKEKKKVKILQKALESLAKNCV